VSLCKWHCSIRTDVYIWLIFVTAIAAILAAALGSQWFHLLKPLTTMLIIGLLLGFGASLRTRFIQLMIVGLVFCLVGDVFLLYDQAFVMGLAVFLIAHILFASAFIVLAHRIHLSWATAWPLVCFAVAYMWFLWPGLGTMKLPVLIYVIAIVLMSWQALGLHGVLKNAYSKIMALGAILFMLSDSIIAYSRFVDDFMLSQVLILGFYWTAIFLLAWSALNLGKATNSEVAP
jgi:uncharacterized membrane protein YhhN